MRETLMKVAAFRCCCKECMRNTKFSVIKHVTRNALSGCRMHRQDFQVPRLDIDKKAILQLAESRHHFHLRRKPN